MDESNTNESQAENPSQGSEEQAQEHAASLPGTGLTEDKVREQLKQVIDPELFVNIVDLGLIYVVDLKPSETEGKIDITVEMTMTSPMCPAGPQLVANSREAVESIEAVENVEIKVVMDPPWTQDMMSEDAKDQLNIF
ncbi:MAG: metal-sulfur cluster assembly factor [Pirellulaceae bacterium]